VKESWSLKKTELGALIAQNRYLRAVPTNIGVDWLGGRGGWGGWAYLIRKILGASFWEN